MENMLVAGDNADNDEDDQSFRYLQMFGQYEQMISSLSDTVQFYQDEVRLLKEELLNAMKENGQISDKLQEILKTNIELQKGVEQTKFENNIIEDLNEQLQLAYQEKQSVTELWQSSLKTIDNLEQELSICRGDKGGFISQNYYKHEKEKYENELENLKSALQSLQEKLRESLELHTTNLKAKNEEINNISEENKRMKNLVEKYEEEIRKNQLKHDAVQKKFLNLLEEKHLQIESLLKKETELKFKMDEALAVAEFAAKEKDMAILREAKTKKEAENFLQQFDHMRQELDSNLGNQLKTIEKLYFQKENDFKKEIEDLKTELNNKEVELKKYKHECEILNDELKRIKQGNWYIDETNTSRLLIMDKNIETTFQKLILSEKKCIQVASEKDSVKADLEQMRNMYENEMKNKEIEKNALHNKIINLQNELDLSKKGMLMITERFEKLAFEIDKLTIVNKKSLVNKDQRNQKTTDELNKLKENYSKIQKLTQKHLTLQKEINAKWQKGIEETTIKFENRIRELKNELSKLKKKNQHLENAVRISNATMEEYRTFYNQLRGIAQNISTLEDTPSEA